MCIRNKKDLLRIKTSLINFGNQDEHTRTGPCHWSLRAREPLGPGIQEWGPALSYSRDPYKSITTGNLGVPFSLSLSIQGTLVSSTSPSTSSVTGFGLANVFRNAT